MFCFKIQFFTFPIFSWFDDKQKKTPKHKLEHVFNYLRKPTSISNTVTDRGPSCWIFLVLIKSSFYTFTSKHYSVSFYHWWFENDIYIYNENKKDSRLKVGFRLWYLTLLKTEDLKTGLMSKVYTNLWKNLTSELSLWWWPSVIPRTLVKYESLSDFL